MAGRHVQERSGRHISRRLAKSGSAWILRLHRASKPHPTFFLLGGSSDRDSGGFVLAEMARNIRVCVQDKAAKVAEVRSRYPEWWLVLVDYIGYGLDSADQDELKALVELSAAWDRIVLVNPSNTRQGFELGLPI